MSATHFYFNSDPELGMTEPLEAASPEALADDVAQVLESHAIVMGRPLADVRAEFIAGLTEVPAPTE